MPVCILLTPVIGSLRKPKGLDRLKEPGAVLIGGIAGMCEALSPATWARAKMSS